MSEISILNRDIQLNINWEHLNGIPNTDLLACNQASYFNHKFTIGAVYHKDSQSYSFHS